MKTLLTCIRREYWENKGLFVTLPLGLAGLVLLVSICSMIVYLSIGAFHGVLPTPNPQTDAHLIAGMVYATSIPFVVVLWLIMAYYCLSCLYDDRRDRSILFWQSLPISQTQSIGSKLIAGLVLAPLCTMGILIVTQIILLILASISLLIIGFPLIGLLWHPLILVDTWIKFTLALWLQSAWLLPFAGWFMLCSAYAKRGPFLRAIAPWVVILILEAFFMNHAYLWQAITNQFAHASMVIAQVCGLHPHHNAFAPDQLHNWSIPATQAWHGNGWLVLAKQFAQPALWIGAVIGGACLIVAGRLRGRCYE